MTFGITFGARVHAAMRARGPLCAGIDPHAALLHEWGLDDSVAGLERFALGATEALAAECAVVKPQSAFYERFGSRGVAVLERVIATAREGGALVLLDVKRGDIGSTSEAYAEAYLDPASPVAADAITVSPFLGFGSLDSFVDAARKHDAGLFVLARTSNKEAPEVQAARTDDGRSVTGTILDHLRGLNAGAEPLGSFGAVVGATLEETGEDFVVNGPLLAPGYGAQGRYRGGPPADLRRGTARGAAQLLARAAPRRSRHRGDARGRSSDERRAPGRHRVRLAAALLLVLVLVSGCGGDDYCGAVEEHQAELTDVTASGSPAALLEALPIFRDLADGAPDDIRDDWDALLDPLEELDDSLRAADVDPRRTTRRTSRRISPTSSVGASRRPAPPSPTRPSSRPSTRSSSRPRTCATPR